MKYLLLVTCLALSGCAYAQEPIYTPMKGNYKFKGLKADTLLLIPSFNDTTAANATYLDQVAGAMIRCGNDFWMRNASTTAWLQNVNVGNGSSPAVNFVKKVYRKDNRDSIFYIINPTDTQYAFTDRGFDTLRRSNDSVYAYRFGAKVFQYKDSGSARLNDSPDRINGSASKNIGAIMNGFSLGFSNVDAFNIENSNITSIVGNKYIYLNGIDSLILRNNNLKQLLLGNKLIFKNNNNTFIDVDTLGNIALGNKERDSLIFKINKSSEDLFIKSKNPSIWQDWKGNRNQIQTSYGRNDIDVNSANDTIWSPGVYIINGANNLGTYKLYIPDAKDWIGQSFTFLSKTGGDNTFIESLGGDIRKRDFNLIDKIEYKDLITFYSDGENWFAFYSQ